MTDTPHEDDWRLTDQEDYLQGIALVHKAYTQWSESWDHDHCQFCWAKFMPAGAEPPAGSDEPIHREGYANVDVAGHQDHYWWICEECFEDFKDRFAWSVRPTAGLRRGSREPPPPLPHLTEAEDSRERDAEDESASTR